MPGDRRSGEERRTFQRPFFAVADGIFDHLPALQGAKLPLYMLILRETKHRPIWEGWTVEGIADFLGLSESQIRRALRGLAARSPLTGKCYVALYFGMGRKPNKLQVLNWIRQPIDEHPCLPMEEEIVNAVENPPNGGHPCSPVVSTDAHQSAPNGGHPCSPMSAQPVDSAALARRLDSDSEDSEEGDFSASEKAGYSAARSEGAGSRSALPPGSRPAETGPAAVLAEALARLRTEHGMPRGLEPERPQTAREEADRKQLLRRQAEQYGKGAAPA